MNKKAFTLIELLVVVLIIGILAAIAVPQYQKAVDKTNFTQAKILANALSKAEANYYLANGEYATNVDNLDISLPQYKDRRTNENRSDTLYFDWGYCQVWYTGAGDCLIYSINAMFEFPFTGEKRCLSYNTDINARENQFCASETGDTNPEIGRDYIRWFYK